MANGKNPTRKQRMMIKSWRLNPTNWLVVKNPPGELHLVHRHTGNKRVIKYSA